MSYAYEASSIEVLSGLEPVRKRPGMYTDTETPNHLAMEVVDNAVDEVLAGYASEIQICLYQDGSLSVADNGRGMPTDIHPEHGESGVALILTKLHAGAKFSNEAYRYAGGLHGVGVSVVNALSVRIDVEVDQAGHTWKLVCENGVIVQPLTKIAEIAKKKTGTRVRFWPDAKFFNQSDFLVPKLLKLLEAKAILCADLKITWLNEEKEEKITWHYPDGLQEYVLGQVSDELIPEVPIQGQHEEQEQAVEWSIGWLADGYVGQQQSFVNLIPTPQGGTHYNGFKQGLLDAFREYGSLHQLLPKNLKLKSEDVIDGAVAILSYKLKEPQFAGQTKERLTNVSAASYIQQAVKNTLEHWLNKHMDEAKSLLDLVVGRAQKRLRQSQRITRKSPLQGPQLPGKLSDCLTQDRDEAELFLVEGDSAGGSCKQARLRHFQAVLPLRGKILNTWEVSSEQVLSSQEVHDISVAIGMDPGSADISNRRYGKLCILADADSDGLHIATLICALCVKHFRALVEHGCVYVAKPPLFRIDIGKDVYYAQDTQEKEAVLRKFSHRQVQVQRFKGLGEMNPPQLRETTMDPATRKLVQLTVEQWQDMEEKMNVLLCKKQVKQRRVWLESQGSKATIA